MKTITITISKHTIVVGAAFVVTFLIGMCLGVSIGMHDGYRAHQGALMIRSNEMSGTMMGDSHNMMWYRAQAPTAFDINQ